MAETQLRKLCDNNGISGPPNSIREAEDYKVELSNVTILELTINPSIDGGIARASLKNLRLS
jgi:hypothetical protein